MLLHPFYGLREEGYSAIYNSEVARRGVEGFLHDIGANEGVYREAIRRFAERLYLEATDGSEADIFLDKTPRYHYVLPEIIDTFQDARFIFLYRNPLAVISSIRSNWVKGIPLMGPEYRGDLLGAPEHLVQSSKLLGSQVIEVQFEKLVREPEPSIRRICEFLDLEFDPAMVHYGREGHPSWNLGDQTVVNERNKPDPDIAEAWKPRLENPQTWRLARDYLEMLDDKTVNEMGYEPGELRGLLSEYKPPFASRILTLGLRTCLREKQDPVYRVYRKYEKAKEWLHDLRQSMWPV